MALDQAMGDKNIAEKELREVSSNSTKFQSLTAITKITFNQKRKRKVVHATMLFTFFIFLLYFFGRRESRQFSSRLFQSVTARLNQRMKISDFLITLSALPVVFYWLAFCLPCLAHFFYSCRNGKDNLLSVKVF